MLSQPMWITASRKPDLIKKRLFYTQGDYGLFQCSGPCCQETFENAEIIRSMVKQQKGMRIPTELLPVCPHCGKPLTMNLRSDDKFVEDEGWHEAAERYQLFLHRHQNMRILFLELGVGYNTPVIIKYPFWRMTLNNPKATYAVINYGRPSVLTKSSADPSVLTQILAAFCLLCSYRKINHYAVNRIVDSLTPHRLAASAWDTCPDLHILTTFFLSPLEIFSFLDIQNAPFSAFSAFFTVRFEGSISGLPVRAYGPFSFTLLLLPSAPPGTPSPKKRCRISELFSCRGGAGLHRTFSRRSVPKLWHRRLPGCRPRHISAQ